MPGLPGAQKSLPRRGLAEIAQAKACSRPPEPMRRTLSGVIEASLWASYGEIQGRRKVHFFGTGVRGEPLACEGGDPQ